MQASTASGLSLCMIVRDEQEMLPGFLQSVEGLWDELCVVDTGSVDSTRSILREAGARIESFEWCDDFSAARNASLDMARCDWIMFLDADERPSRKLVAQVRRLLAEDEYGAATLIMRNPMPHGHVRKAPLLRLFRNVPSVRFVHAIHEDISESVAEYLKISGKSLASLSAEVEHLGYCRERASEVDKRSRDERLLRMCIDKDPTDYYSRYKLMELARFWSDDKMWQKEARESLQVLKKAPARDLRGFHFAGEFVALIAMGLHRDDPESALELLKRWPHERSAPYLMCRAELYERTGKLSLAMADYRACLHLPKARNRQLTGVRPLLGLSRTAMMAQRMHDAYKLAQRALYEAPRDPEALFAVISLSRILDGEKGVEDFKEAYMKKFGNCPELENAFGEDALMSGFPGKALAHFETLARDDPDNASIKARIAQALLADNRIQQASGLARSICAQLPDAWMGVLVCDLLLGRDSDIDVDLSPEQLNRAMRPWVDAVRASPHAQLRKTLAMNAPALEHVFPWLPKYLAA